MQPKQGRTVGSNRLWLCAVWTLLGGTLVSLLAMLLCGAVYARFNLPAATIDVMATGSVCLGAAIGAYLFVQFWKKQGVLCGFCVGLVFFAALFLASLLAGQRQFGGQLALRLLGLCTAGGMGGYCGLVRTEKRKGARR